MVLLYNIKTKNENFSLENISLQLKNKQIFDKINFLFKKYDKIGVIADNAVGKTSLFNIILEKQIKKILEKERN